MSLLLQLLAQFLRCLAQLCEKDGLKAVLAQNLLLTQQLIVLTRGRKRAPPVTLMHRDFLKKAIQIPVLTKETREART